MWLTGTLLVQADSPAKGSHLPLRARVWQKYENGAWLHSPTRRSDTRTLVAWPVLVGGYWVPMAAGKRGDGRCGQHGRRHYQRHRRPL